MKIAVLNYSGNVGKTTIARHLLLPRVPGATLVSIETINADETQDNALRGKDFAQLQEFLLSSESAIIDVGASNIEELLIRMRKYKGSQEDFDYFVVPCVPAKKQQSDTIATLVGLFQMGVSPKKIRVVFNQVDDDEDLTRTFHAVLLFAKQEGLTAVQPGCSIANNELFQRLKGTSTRLSDLANDKTDYKALVAKTSDQTEKLALVDKLATKRLALGVVPELDDCFAALELA